MPIYTTKEHGIDCCDKSLQYHVFNSAVSIGSLALQDPGNALASLALNQIEAAIGLLTGLNQSGGSSQRSRSNLEWLLKLRARVVAKMASSQAQQQQQNSRDSADIHAVDDGDDSEEDVELLGWRTRLIERASQNHHTAKTIRSSASPAGASNSVNDLSRFATLPSAFTHQLGQSSGAVPLSGYTSLADSLVSLGLSSRCDCQGFDCNLSCTHSCMTFGTQSFVKMFSMPPANSPAYVISFLFLFLSTCSSSGAAR